VQERPARFSGVWIISACPARFCGIGYNDNCLEGPRVNSQGGGWHLLVEVNWTFFIDFQLTKTKEVPMNRSLNRHLAAFISHSVLALLPGIFAAISGAILLTLGPSCHLTKIGAARRSAGIVRRDRMR
jgi:hypothetical protein